MSDSNETPVFQADVRLLTFGQGNSVFRGFTDGAGRVSFNGVAAGDYYLEVTKQEYEAGRERVEIRGGSLEYFSIRLQLRSDNSSAVRNAAVVSATSLAAPPDAQAAFEKGQTLLNDHPGESIKQFRDAIKKYPEYAEAYQLLGYAYFRNKQPEEAVSALKKAIELDPKLAFAHTLLGKIYLEDKKFKDAEKLLLASIELDSQTWNAPYELARCYFNLGRMDDALTYARRAHELPNAASTTHLLLVDIYLRKKETKNALRELEHFSKADPQSPLMPRVREMMERLKKEK